jgi:hypothetical protein
MRRNLYVYIHPPVRMGRKENKGWWKWSKGSANKVSQSQQYHLNNPYWKTFDPYVLPLLDGPMDLRRFEELDTSQDVKVD